MKKKFLAAIITNILCLGLLAQENGEKTVSPPAKVKAKFEMTFPGATKAKWEKESNDFEVNFILQKKEMSAVFDKEGEWKETEEEIKISELPSQALAYINSHYNGSKIKEATKITKPGNIINYEAEVNKIDVLFDVNGNFLKEEND